MTPLASELGADHQPVPAAVLVVVFAGVSVWWKRR